MRDPLLSGDVLANAFAPLGANGWIMTEDQARITKSFRFANFQTAFGWMTTCALWAERLDHHPKWTNNWNRVVVELTTHDSKGLTWRDIELAKQMDTSAKSIQQG